MSSSETGSMDFTSSNLVASSFEEFVASLGLLRERSSF